MVIAHAFRDREARALARRMRRRLSDRVKRYHLKEAALRAWESPAVDVQQTALALAQQAENAFDREGYELLAEELGGFRNELTSDPARASTALHILILQLNHVTVDEITKDPSPDPGPWEASIQSVRLAA